MGPSSWCKKAVWRELMKYMVSTTGRSVNLGTSGARKDQLWPKLP